MVIAFVPAVKSYIDCWFSAESPRPLGLYISPACPLRVPWRFDRLIRTLFTDILLPTGLVQTLSLQLSM